MLSEEHHSRTDRWRGIAKMLWQCVRNDPFDLCFEQSSEMLGKRVGDAALRLGPRQIAGRLLNVFRLALQALHARGAVEQPLRGKILVLGTSANQFHSVEPVIECLGAVAILGDAAFRQRMRHLAALYTLPFLPLMVLRCLNATAYQRSTLPASFADYWMSYGLFLAACRMLRAAPRLVLATSDHAAMQRTITFAARFMGIPTAFLPHAGVTKGLPPLSFDAAFLDGLYAARRYADCGRSKTAIFLAGVPRLDAVMQRPRRGRRRLGLCPGLCDDAALVIELVSRAVEALPAAAVTVRPHPREPAKERYIEMARALGCIYSDAQQEPAGTFLQTVDIVVCGDSNLIIEAKVAGRWVVIFAPPQARIIDQYGYIEDGLPHVICRDAADLLDFLATTNGRPPIDGLDRYMATIETLWEGRSAELVATTLLDLAAGRAHPGTLAWQPIASATTDIWLPPSRSR
jgi:hypothetical protein